MKEFSDKGGQTFNHLLNISETISKKNKIDYLKKIIFRYVLFHREKGKWKSEEKKLICCVFIIYNCAIK